MPDRGTTKANRSTETPPPAPRAVESARTAARDFAIQAARALSDDKCHEIVVLDVHTMSQVTDFIVIGSGTSDRQMLSSIKNVEALGAGQGFGVFRTNSDDRASWLLADFVDVIVHVFEPNTRAHYDLEMLWGDAPRLDWQRHEPKSPRRSSGH